MKSRFTNDTWSSIFHIGHFHQCTKTAHNLLSAVLYRKVYASMCVCVLVWVWNRALDFSPQLHDDWCSLHTFMSVNRCSVLRSIFRVYDNHLDGIFTAESSHCTIQHFREWMAGKERESLEETKCKGNKLCAQTKARNCFKSNTYTDSQPR